MSGRTARGTFAERATAFLASPRGRLLPPLAAALLALPSIANGLAFDDLLQRAQARAPGATFWEQLDLFTFVPADVARKAALVERGLVPWFAAPDLRVSFFRPLSALFAWFDFSFLAPWPALMHLESIATYVVVVLVVAALYRRFLTPTVAALAALVFAVDDAHGVAVGWLADRNALLSTGFGVGAVIAHDRWRRDHWRMGAVVGPAAFALALLSAEAGSAAFAYVIAYALTFDRGARSLRAWSLAPYALVGVSWQVVYRALDHGARGSGVYVDPIAATGEFLKLLPGHVAALALGQLALPPSDLYIALSAPGKAAYALAAASVVVLIAWVVAPRVMKDPSLRFFALGAALAILPIAATFPSDRLLTLVGVGGAALVAAVIGAALDGDESTTRPRAERYLRRVWVGVHLVVAPLLLP